MKGSLSAAEVHKQYSDGITAFRRQIADATLRVKFTQEVDTFMRACALGVWQRDGASPTPRYVEYYNAIYTKGNPVPSILFWELSTAVSEYPGFRVPDFFARMRACDKVAGTRLARRFIDLVTLMVLLFAAVDDAVADGVDLVHGADHAVLGAGELVDDGGDGLGVRGEGEVLVKNGLAAHQRGVLQVPVDADALAQALGQHVPGGRVHQLIFQGRASCVDDENFHFPISFLLFTIVNCGRGIVLWILLLYPYMP